MCPPQLVFRKIDDKSGLGLCGAQFTLTDPSGFVQTCVSNCQGIVSFPVQIGISYTLKETSVPAGYTASGYNYKKEGRRCC